MAPALVAIIKVRIWNMKSLEKDVENEDSTQRVLAALCDRLGFVNCVRWAKIK